MAGTALPGDEVRLEIERELPGRAVLASPDGSVHLGRNYGVYRTDDDGVTLRRISALPRSPLRRLAEGSRLACRLLRHEVRALARLDGGAYVAANREGVFFGREGDATFAPSRVADGGLRVLPPMRIGVGPDGACVWGEYGSVRTPRPIRLYASRDGGRRFEVVRALAAGSVLHVHNVIYDAGEGHYWVLAGDHDREPGIGRLSVDLERFDWLVKGEQRFRAVEVFDFGDRLVYATDTEMERNGLISLDKRTGRAERLRDFEGSCIYAARFGGLYALTTSVEPSAVNRSRFAELWLSRDGARWQRAARFEKDRWSADWFQFGSIVLPSGRSGRDVIVFSGQALRGLDGRTAVARVAAGETL